MKTLKTIAVLIVLGAFSAQAQQQTQYSQYMQNQFLLNPAVAGIEDFMDVKTGFRRQWLGFSDAPATMYVSAHKAINQAEIDRQELEALPIYSNAPIRFKVTNRKKQRHGLGGYAFSDRSGNFSRTGAYASYAFHQPIKQKFYLAGGIGVGYMNYSLSLDGVTTEEGIPEDNALNGGLNQNVLPDLNFGLMAYGEKFFVGLSGFQLLQNELDFGTDRGDITNAAQLSNHYYATAGYKIPISYEITAIPSVMAKYVTGNDELFKRGAPISFDAGARVIYNRKFWGGLNYRMDNEIQSDGLIIMLGTTIKNFLDIGYSYDLPISDISAHNTGSHEIVVGVRLFNRKRLPRNLP